MAARTARRTAAQWLALVAQQRESGLSIAGFARREELVYQTFISWCRKADQRRERARRALAARATAGETATSSTVDVATDVLPGFVELGIAGGDPRAADHRNYPERDWLVELELGTGVTLRIRCPA